MITRLDCIHVRVSSGELKARDYELCCRCRAPRYDSDPKCDLGLFPLPSVGISGYRDRSHVQLIRPDEELSECCVSPEATWPAIYSEILEWDEDDDGEPLEGELIDPEDTRLILANEGKSCQLMCPKRIHVRLSVRVFPPPPAVDCSAVYHSKPFVRCKNTAMLSNVTAS